VIVDLRLVRLNAPSDRTRRRTVEALGAELDQCRLEEGRPDVGPRPAEPDLVRRVGLAFASALADALRRRGVADPAAGLAAEAGIAVFKIAFEQWTSETNRRDLSQLIRDSFDQLKAVTTSA
jgi:hypothetical protein